MNEFSSEVFSGQRNHKRLDSDGTDVPECSWPATPRASIHVHRVTIKLGPGVCILKVDYF